MPSCQLTGIRPRTFAVIAASTIKSRRDRRRNIRSAGGGLRTATGDPSRWRLSVSLAGVFPCHLVSDHPGTLQGQMQPRPVTPGSANLSSSCIAAMGTPRSLETHATERAGIHETYPRRPMPGQRAGRAHQRVVVGSGHTRTCKSKYTMSVTTRPYPSFSFPVFLSPSRLCRLSFCTVPATVLVCRVLLTYKLVAAAPWLARSPAHPSTLSSAGRRNRPGRTRTPTV